MEILIAYTLDLLWGDPPWFPHPVKGMGFMIEKLENLLRRSIPHQKLAGIILAFLVAGGVWCISQAVIFYLKIFNPYLASLASIFFLYTCFATKDLAVEARRVYQDLEKKDLDRARKDLSLIVGRDTSNLGQSQIIRATVETVAENTVDGIISPLFYAFLGGAPLALAYKAINTLDSMVGYKNERYKEFGWASARLDDLANFLPARISGLIMSLAFTILKRNGGRSFIFVLRDGNKHPSPNSGIPQAAVAGGLAIQLGGVNFYNSRASFKPLIGENINPLKMTHIIDTIKISYISSFLMVVAGLLSGYMIKG